MANYQPRQKTYWWVVASWKGKTIVRGPYPDEQEAYSKGFEVLDCQFEVIPLPTRSKSEASSTVRDRILTETHNIDRAMERQLHKPPQEYKKRWWKKEEE